MGGAFADAVRQRLTAAGLSQAALATRVPMSPAYLSRILAGKRQPTVQIAEGIDRALGADGELAALVGGPEPVVDGRRPMDDGDLQRLHDTVRQLVALDTAHGSDGLYVVAARAFHAARDQMAYAGVKPAHRSDLNAAVAEVGEVAAWLAYDSEQHDASRQLATEAALVARVAGDRSMERFLLSHLAMQAVYLDRGAEALAIADRVLTEEPRSARVTAMMRVRRARALGVLGDRTAGLAELAAARPVLERGLRPEDPSWTWWLHDAEFAVHEGRLRAATGDRRGAVAASQAAVEALPAGQSRDHALYRAWLLRDLVDARGWRDADFVAEDLQVRLSVAGSARVARLLRGAARSAEQSKAPGWLRDAVRAAGEAYGDR